MESSSYSGDYGSLEPLAIRIETHERLSARADNPETAVIEALGMSGDESLLDVGAGTGSFLRRLRAQGHRGRLVALDSSTAALEAVNGADSVEAVHADAQRVPFADLEFDVVTARHMLYHVEDPLAAVREAHRVLGPAGRFVAVVNERDSIPATRAMLRRIVARHGVELALDHGAPVHAENIQAIVASAFVQVRLIEHPNELVFSADEDLARFSTAMLGLYGVPEDSPVRDAVVADLAAEARRLIDASGGELRDPKGYVVAVGFRDDEKYSE